MKRKQPSIKISLLRSLTSVLLLIISAIAAVLLQIPSQAAKPQLYPSQYASTITAPFNQSDYYSITAKPPAYYRPVGEWVGRLILPTAEQYQQMTSETDWVWLEVQVAPANANQWVGQRVRLAWQQTPATQAYVTKASRNVRFTPEVQKTLEKGVIHPVRLNGRDRVGPLQSLAGARPLDDMTVVLRGNVKQEGNPGATPTLRVVREPVQETGGYYGLVKLIEPVPPVAAKDLPTQCPGNPPCPGDRFRVRHYNPASRQFDGAEEILRIPQQPQDKDGVFNITTRDLVQSPAGEAGWYIKGAFDQANEFTVQAMQPRSIVQLQPQQIISSFNKGLDYINFRNWQDVEPRKGTIQTVLIDSTAKASDAGQSIWKEGDRALLMHLFGGRGGTHTAHESLILGTYAGHFSFGLAQVVRDPFTEELIFDLNYLQVYGNSSDGTISGAQTWHNYMGSLIRGKAGTRPVSDLLVKLDTLTEDYNFGDTRLSFFNELLGELSLIGARYRIGDGSGDSTITSATSCVQDSAQGLFLAIQRFRQTIEANPQVIEWMRSHPNDPTTQRFQKLVRLGKDLAEQVTPLGVLRWDWAQNAEVLTGVRLSRISGTTSDQFVSISDYQIRNLLTGLISWRTALPRQAHDELGKLFLHHGAKLWFLRPNQIGGNDPGIAPLEATLAAGGWKLPFTQIPIFAVLINRTFGGVTIPKRTDWLIALALLLGLGGSAIALLRTASASSLAAPSVLPWNSATRPWWRSLLQLLQFLVIALIEEYIFRVLLLPYPKPWIPELTWWSWALLAFELYLLYYFLLPGRSWKQSDAISRPVRFKLVALLGITCTIAYRLTGSLWIITVIHSIAISVWWLWLGNKQQFYVEQPRLVQLVK
jgi:predicted Abi (CAAX) family protease